MKYIYSLLIVFFAVFIWSAINPFDYFTWFLEIVPALIGVGILSFTYRRFRFTNLVYFLILIHSVILMAGGHYTYAEVPLFDSLADVLNHTRNNYDKVGHFAQGFIPALIIREIVIRQDVINGAKWRSFIIVCICLAISAAYEFIEWFVAIQSGEDAESFLGTQGYIWDTQSDMLFATMGAISALVLLSNLHNRQLKSII